MQLVGDGASPDRMQVALNHVRMQVTPENILKVRALFLTEAERVTDVIRGLTLGRGVESCGGDPLSPEAAKAFNRRIAHELEQARLYGLRLQQAGEELGRIARKYGHSDAEIERSFKARDPGVRA